MENIKLFKSPTNSQAMIKAQEVKPPGNAGKYNPASQTHAVPGTNQI